MPRRTYANAVLEEEETKMMDHSPQIQQVQGEKDAVLVEALRIYYQNQEQTRWRQVRTPGV